MTHETDTPALAGTPTLQRWIAVTGGNESPAQYHRWAFITAAACLLERNVWFRFGSKRIYPNMYVFLIGATGARKNGAISPVKELLRLVGYKKFAKQRTSSQQFMVELARGYDMDEALNAGPDSIDATFVAAEEFLDFIGVGNLTFVTLLTNLWDNLPKYEESYRKSEAVICVNPTISILGGMTPTNLMLSLPAESGGIGFLSRAVLVYSEPPKTRITFPRTLEETQLKGFAEAFKQMSKLKGEMVFSQAGAALLDNIYQNYRYLDDARLGGYCSRRLEHLIKLCLVLAALNDTMVITDEIVLEANSILAFTEEDMRRSFGEFGKSRNSEASHKLISYMEHRNAPCGVDELFKVVAQDIDRFQDVHNILLNLEKAERIMRSGSTYILKRVDASQRRRFTAYSRYIAEAEALYEYERDCAALGRITANTDE